MAPTVVQHLGSPSEYTDLSLKGKIGVRLLRFADMVTAINRDEVESLRRAGFPTEYLATLPNAIDTDIFRPADKQQAKNTVGLRDDRQYITYVGRIRDSKNVPLLVDVLDLVSATFPEIQLLVVGGGDDTHIKNIKSKCHEIGLESKVHLVGPVSYEDIADYYNCSELIVSPSHAEGVSMTTLESAACQTPFVGTSAHDATFFESGKNCLLSDTVSAKSIADAVLRLLRDRQWASKIAQRAHDDVIDVHGMDRVATKVINVYETAVEHHTT
jgi:glycosyltransferase involved in cell wall biosynthesis